jgi:hypothetical protein
MCVGFVFVASAKTLGPALSSRSVRNAFAGVAEQWRRRPANRGLANETKNNDLCFLDRFRSAWLQPKL